VRKKCSILTIIQKYPTIVSETDVISWYVF
jgi:hypothetical protein